MWFWGIFWKSSKHFNFRENFRKFIQISIVAKISYKSPNSFCFALSLHVWIIRQAFRHFRKQFSRNAKTNTFFEKKFVTFASNFREMRKRTSFSTLILIAQIFRKSTALLVKTKGKYEVRSKTNSNVSISGDRIICKVVLLNIKYSRLY
jgi:hypothetical protein